MSCVSPFSKIGIQINPSTRSARKKENQLRKLEQGHQRKLNKLDDFTHIEFTVQRRWLPFLPSKVKQADILVRQDNISEEPSHLVIKKRFWQPLNRFFKKVLAAAQKQEKRNGIRH